MGQDGQDEAVAARVAWLEAQVALHNRRYYDLDSPLVSDPEYDALRAELERLRPDSPVLRDIGHAVFGEKYRHRTLMGSLLKCHGAAEILAKFAGTEVTLMPKIDGCSLSLHYEHGALVRAVTRGDGVEGELVTANARFVRNLPARIPAPEPFLEVRGEAYIAKGDFYGKMDQGEDALANPRNATAGGLRQKDPTFTQERKIRFVAYELLGDPALRTHAAKFARLAEFGFVTPPLELAVFRESAAATETLARLRDAYEQLEYEIDGVVVRVNSQAAFDSEGWSGKCPKGALAFKFETEKKAARILGFEWATSRNGRVCPVALIEPTPICGSTVARITLHNLEWMQQQDVAVGDRIRFEKANEIIPKLVEVLERPAGRRTEIPAACPSCGAHLINKGVDLVCQNPDCPAQFEETVIHLLDELGIKEVGKVAVESVITAGLIKHPWEILDITSEKLKTVFVKGRLVKKNKDKNCKETIPTVFKCKEAKNIEAALRDPVATEAQLLSALGIPGWGRRLFEILLRSEYYSIDDFVSGIDLDIKKIASIKGIGGNQTKNKKAENEYLRAMALKNGMKQKNVFLRELYKRVKVTSERDQASNQALKGLSFCVTGTFVKPRSEVHKLIKSLGGIVTDSVTKELNYLIAGESAGMKLSKAAKLGVKIITEAEFDEMCGLQSQSNSNSNEKGQLMLPTF
ncbi:MAG: NAD-dependent DNA ligase LigA [Lentisphaeria bacterium]